MLERLLALFRDGGATLPPLLIMALFLWGALGARRATLSEVGAQLAGRLEPRTIDRLRAELTIGAAPIRAVVLTAPLLGLLGTVTGMIETFDSLATMELFSRSGGVAGGVSQALISTQVGLVVAIPGAIAGRMLQRRADLLDAALQEVPR